MKRTTLFFSLILLASPLLLGGDYQKGLSYYKQNQFAKAAVEFEEIVKEQPEYEFGHRILGLSYLNTQQYTKAIESFRAALRLKEDNFTSYSGLALAYFNSGRYSEVIPTLNRAEKYAKSPRDQYLLNQTRGSAAFNVGNYELAASSLQKATSLQRGGAEDVLQLGIAYFELGREADALTFLQQAAQLLPNREEPQRYLRLIRYQKGVRLIEAGQYREAATTLAEYLKNNDADADGWFNLGLAYLFSENLSAAEEAFRRNSRLAPGNGPAFDRLGYIYEKQKKYTKSLEAYRKAYELTGDAQVKASVDRVQKRLQQG